MKAKPLLDFDIIKEEIISLQSTLVELKEEKRQAHSQNDKCFSTIVEGILETLDMCERLQEQEESTQLRRVIRKLQRVLSDQGIESIQIDQVDPLLCRVVETTTDPSKPSGAILRTLRRGYRKGDKVVRPADVLSNRH
jgi:molecular chaperone GrpE